MYEDWEVVGEGYEPIQADSTADWEVVGEGIEPSEDQNNFRWSDLGMSMLDSFQSGFGGMLRQAEDTAALPVFRPDDGRSILGQVPVLGPTLERLPRIAAKGIDAIIPDGFGEDMQRVAQESMAERKPRYDALPYGGQVAFDVASNIGEYALPTLASVYGGSGIPSMLYGFGKMKGQKYGEYVDKGLPYEQATDVSTLQGLVQGALERLSVPGLNLGKTLGGTVAKELFKGGVEEAGQEIAEDAVDNSFAGYNIPLMDSLKNAGHAALVGSLAGGVSAGMYDGAGRYFENKRQAVETKAINDLADNLVSASAPTVNEAVQSASQEAEAQPVNLALEIATRDPSVDSIAKAAISTPDPALANRFQPPSPELTSDVLALPNQPQRNPQAQVITPEQAIAAPTELAPETIQQAQFDEAVRNELAKAQTTQEVDAILARAQAARQPQPSIEEVTELAAQERARQESQMYQPTDMPQYDPSVVTEDPNFTQDGQLDPMGEVVSAPIEEQRILYYESTPSTKTEGGGGADVGFSKITRESILDANKKGMQSPDEPPPYQTPILHAAYTWGAKGIDLSAQPSVVGPRYGKNETGISNNSRDEHSELGLSLSVKPDGSPVGSSVFFEGRDKFFYKGLLLPNKGSDGEALILPYDYLDFDNDPPQQQSLPLQPKRMGGEAGAVFNPISPVVEKLSKVTKDLSNSFFNDKSQPAGINEDLNIPASEQKYGRMKQDGWIKDLKDAGLKGYRDKAVFATTLARKDSDYQPTVDAGRNYLEYIGDNHSEALDALVPFYSLPESSQKKVGQLAQALRVADAKGAQITDQSIAATMQQQGFTEAEAKGYASVVRAMKEVAPEMYKQGILAKAQTKYGDNPEMMARIEQKLDEQVKQMQEKWYVPFGRHGDFYVYEPGFKADGQDGWFSLHETKAEQQKAIRDLKKQGFDARYGTLRNKTKDKSGKSDYIPVDIRARLDELGLEGDDFMTDMLGGRDADPDASTEDKQAARDARKAAKQSGKTYTQDGFIQQRSPEGFTKHLLRASLTAGQSVDVGRAMADYFHGLGIWNAQQKGRRDYDAAWDAIPQDKVFLKNRNREDADYILNPHEEFQKLRQFYAAWYLSRASTSLVNLTQNLTTTAAELSGKNYYNSIWKGHKEVGKAMKKTSHYLIGRHFNSKAADSFSKSNPELAADLHNAFNKGIISDQATREFQARATSSKFNESSMDSLSDILLMGMRGTEYFNRTSAFIAGWEFASKKGMTGDARFKLAEKLAYDTQFDQTKVNRPKMFRGKGAPFGLFRNFMGNYIRFLRNGIEDKDWRKLITSFGWMFSMAGIGSFPFLKDMLAATKTWGGVDVNKAIRETSKKYLPENMHEFASDSVIYGPLSASGITPNLSGALSAGEMLPNFERGLEATIVRYFAGVLIDPVQRALSAYDTATRRGNPGRKDSPIGLPLAAEDLMPPQLRTIHQALRWGNADSYLNKDMSRSAYDPTGRELTEKAVGFNPIRLAKEMEQKHSSYLIGEEEGDSANINRRYAVAKMEGNYALMNELQVEAIINGTPINMGQVKKMEKDAKTGLANVPKKAMPFILQYEGLMGR